MSGSLRTLLRKKARLRKLMAEANDRAREARRLGREDQYAEGRSSGIAAALEIIFEQ